MADNSQKKRSYNGEIDEFISRRYRVIARLNQGGTSEIFKAVDTADNSRVVIKILQSHDSGAHNNEKDDSRGKTLDISHRTIERSAEFMIQEANFLKNCKHPNIIRLHDFDLNGQRPYIILSYLGNNTLEKEIFKSSLNFSLKKTLEILKQLCSALEYVHNKGFVYCDVKPSNVISRKQKFTLIDFGLVRPIGMPVIGGTLGYMAPEILEKDSNLLKASPTLDVYSLGVLLYELLTGFHPLASHKFQGNEMASIPFDAKTILDKYAPPTLASDLNLFLPKVFDQILLKCIHRNPEDRYQTMSSLLKDFENEAAKLI